MYRTIFSTRFELYSAYLPHTSSTGYGFNLMTTIASTHLPLHATLPCIYITEKVINLFGLPQLHTTYSMTVTGSTTMQASNVIKNTQLPH